MTLDIAIDADPEWDSSIAPSLVAAAEAAVAESAFPLLATAARTVEIAVRLTGDAEVRGLNARWRGKDSATNVLSFPLAEAEELEAADGNGPELLLGDVVLARGVCAAEAADKGIALAAHAAHLVVHGTLHLLGDDHDDDDAAETMEAREVRALARLGIADPYGDRG